MAAAGVIAALGVSAVPADEAGAFGAPAQLLAATALAAMLAALAALRSDRA
jgi:hypothetical protein